MTEFSPKDLAIGFVEAFRLDEYSPYLIAHADHVYTLGMEEAMGRNKISRVAWRALCLLAEHGPQSVGRLAEVTLIKRPTLSRLAERMERDGLVIRHVREKDQRMTDVSITEAGRAVFREVLRIVGMQYARATRGLTKQDIVELNRILSTIIRNLDETPLTYLRRAAPSTEQTAWLPTVPKA